MISIEQHNVEIQENLRAWNEKDLLRHIYADFYARIVARIDESRPGRIVELGSGIGNLGVYVPSAICTDLFPNPWLDIACDAYRLPFRSGSVSHLVMFDVFHHLQRPHAFFAEARRVLESHGRLILFEPYISASSFPVYGLFHHEPVAIRDPIDTADIPPADQTYYAAQGNATRMFFAGKLKRTPDGFLIGHAEAFSSFSYLLSGGYSKRPFYPAKGYRHLLRLDRALSRFPSVFGGRCLVELRPTFQ